MIALVLVGQGERRGRLQQQLQLLPVLRAVGCYRLYLIRKLNVPPPTKSQFDNCQSMYTFNNVTMKTNSKTNHHSHHPIWVPSYPGSGSELFRTMIVALTGMGKDAGGNWYDDHCINYPATCKTHCPFLQKENCPIGRGLYDNSADQKQKEKKKQQQQNGAAPAATSGDENNNDNNYYHPSAILLIRNPRDAIPSYVNWRYENRHTDTIERHHTQQASKEFWKIQRDTNFLKFISGWRQVLLWWVGFGIRQTTYNVSLIIPYEQFVNENTGPTILLQLAEELRRANIPISIAKESKDQYLACLWYSIVKAPKSTTKRVGHKYIPGYTQEQKQIMLQKVNDLITIFSSNSTSTTSSSSNNPPRRMDLVTILTRYRDDIITNLPIDE